jgi:hypothetical protein
MINLPPAVESTTSRYLELIDQALPGQVIGFYLTGSVPLGDFQPGESDIDGVVVVAEPVKDIAVVQEVHAALPSKPAFDVTYLTLDDLALPPDRDKPVVFTLDGVFKEAPRGGPVTPVLWSELARNPLALRVAPGLVVHDDAQALEDFTRDNLTSYWEPTLEQLETAAAALPDDEGLDAWVVPWFVLGIPRLHALLATGNIISKSAAGHHAVAAFPDWSALIERCLAHRAGDEQQFTAAHAKSAVAFGRTVIAAARA